MVFRTDIVGLSTEPLPTKGLQNGSTYYAVDTKQFYIYYEGTWHEQTEEAEE